MIYQVLSGDSNYNYQFRIFSLPRGTTIDHYRIECKPDVHIMVIQ